MFLINILIFKIRLHFPLSIYILQTKYRCYKFKNCDRIIHIFVQRVGLKNVKVVVKIVEQWQ